MCGRYTLAAPNPAVLRERFALGEDVPVLRRFNVAPGDDVLCVTTDREGAPRGDVLRWGLVPHWAKDAAVGYKMINARAESVGERPAFRDALATRRCLVIADGFYEWQPTADRRKQPYWITRADHAPFAFAGLWAIWRPSGSDEALRTCTIVTTQANRVLAPIHDRMPVILPPGAEQAWLAHETPRDAALALLAPFPEDAVGLRPVSRVVNDARHDAPDCLDPPEDDVPTLF